MIGRRAVNCSANRRHHAYHWAAAQAPELTPERARERVAAHRVNRALSTASHLSALHVDENSG
jgi:hypothetical protein